MREFTLPFPPSINHYYRRVGPRTLISREGRAFRKTVISNLRHQQIQTLDGRLLVTITVFPPDRRRRDLDNLLKSTLDALQHAGVYKDDSQIDSLEIHRGPIKPEGSLLIIVSEIKQNRGQ